MCIPGNGGGPVSESWFPSLQAGLQPYGVETVVRDMPDPVHARAEYWLPFMEDVLNIDRDTIVIGHSSGAVAAMRYAETHAVAGLVLVGVCWTDLGMEEERLAGYYDEAWDWDMIRLNSGDVGVTVFAAPDDPWIPFEEAQHVASMLQAEFISLPGEGHFIGFPYGTKREFPELLAVLREMTSD